MDSCRKTYQTLLTYSTRPPNAGEGRTPLIRIMPMVVWGWSGGGVWEVPPKPVGWVIQKSTKVIFGVIQAVEQPLV